MNNKTIILNNGVEMPLVGLGTWALPNDDLITIIKSAYDNGYRKLDTAVKYNNEQEIGNSIKKLNISRKDLFITTKLYGRNLYNFGRDYHPFFHVQTKSIKRAFEESCKRLGTDYIDLYLIHWPYPEYIKFYLEIEKLYKDGRIKAIGVCSFQPKHIDDLMQKASILPAVNQIEISPYNNQKKIVEYCRSNNIQVEAYSSFGGDKKSQLFILEDPLLKDIARNHGKSVAQIINRWLVQQNIAILPRSKSTIHQNENISIFDFELSSEEMQYIFKLNKDIFVWGNSEDVVYNK